MQSTVLHKRTITPGNTPASSILSAGEIALNIADGKMFLKAADDSVKTFLNSEQYAYTLDQMLSSVVYQYGGNTVTEIFGGVLGGINNDVSGAGSTIVNGSDNSISADYAFVGNGSNNTITASGDYGAILGGVNNTLNHQESFILGSNISSHLSGFTYVNNLSVLGKIYGNGSELTNIVGGGGGGAEDVNTAVRNLSGTWSPIKKFDMTYSPNTVSYSGIAQNGSLTSQNVWTITKIVYTNSGLVSSQTIAVNAVWDNRYSINYI